MLKSILKSLRNYKRDSMITIITVVFEVILESIVPLLTAAIIDIGIEGENIRYIFGMGIFLVVIVIISLVFGTLSGNYAAIASSGFASNLRKDMYHNIQDFSFNNIDKFSTSSLITRMTTDVNNFQQAFQMVIRVAVRAPLMFIFAIAASFYVNATLAWMFLGASMILGVALMLIATKAHPIFELIFKRYDGLNTVVQENIRGTRVVKSFVRENNENDKFHKESTSLFRLFSFAEKILAINSPLMQFAIYSCILLISWLGARMIVYGTMSTGDLTSLITYATKILSSLMTLSMVFVMIIMSRASTKRISEVLNEKSNLKSGTNPVYMVADGSIDFNNVNFSYVNQNENLTLNNINLKINSGETVGIIGGTGSSKTSLISLIPRLYDVSEGNVLVGGIDVREYDLKTLRDNVAVVLQKNVLFSGTIKENLKWGNKYATDEELIEVCKLTQAHDFISSFPNGYDTYIEQGGTNVSGGQKQRICIARALLKKPKILILDDSTSAVDTKTDALIQKAFKESIPETTKLIIAQRITSVQDANKIVLLDNGRIHAVGTHEELLKSNKVYQEINESQIREVLDVQ